MTTEGKLESRGTQTNEILLATLIHDMSTPMSVLNFFIHGLKANNLSEFISTYFTSANRALEAIYQILELAKEIHACSINGSSQSNEFNVSSLVDETIFLHSKMAEDKGIRIVNEVPTNLFTTINGHPTWLKNNILGNILSNAIKYSFRGGTIHIKFLKPHLDNLGGTICVSDHGVGIPANAISINNIMKKTTKGTENEVGTGNGLFIAHFLCEVMQAKLSFQSRHFSETTTHGTTFFIDLNHRNRRAE